MYHFLEICILSKTLKFDILLLFIDMSPQLDSQDHLRDSTTL
jgi:hypothetical protein